MTVECTYREAVRDALAAELRRDETVVFLGEDVGAAGGTFKTSVGLYEEFGPRRVMDTPISETGFTGAALGMAITGLRPIVEIMFADFLLVAMDQLVNSIAKYRYMTGGQTAVPLTIRAIGGAGLRFGSQHSATAESWLLPHAGIKIACPATPQDAYDLIRAAVRDDNPVLIVEHKALYGMKGLVDQDRLPGPVAGARVVRPGRHVTIVATLAMVQRALEAASILASEGVEAEVIDPRVLRPFDLDTVVASVRKTKHLLLVAEEPLYAGWTGTVATLVTRAAFDYLDAPPETLTLPESPIPYSPVLEDLALPSAEGVASRVRALIGNG